MAKFVRKNNDPQGRHTVVIRTGINQDTGLPEIREQVVIEGRMIFETDDKKVIETLKKDPEVVEFNKKTQIEVESDEN